MNFFKSSMRVLGLDGTSPTEDQTQDLGELSREKWLAKKRAAIHQGVFGVLGFKMAGNCSGGGQNVHKSSSFGLTLPKQLIQRPFRPSRAKSPLY